MQCLIALAMAQTICGGFVMAADRSEFTETDNIQPHFKLLYTEVGKMKKLF